MLRSLLETKPQSSLLYFHMKKQQFGSVLWMIVGAGCLIVGCLAGDVGKPTDQEATQLQAWSAVVTPKDREAVTRIANQHTDWAERRKVQFMTGEYKKRYLRMKSQPSTTRATTKPSTRRSNRLATAPADSTDSEGL
jgi:hypothetical protein